MKPFFIILLLIFVITPPAWTKDAMVWTDPDRNSQVAWPDCVETVRQIPGTPIFRITFQEGTPCSHAVSMADGVLYTEESQTLAIPDALSTVDGHTCASLADTDLLNNLGTGKDVVAAVIDTGISFTVYGTSSLANTAEIPGDGIDNDQNGYVDDYDGWDFGDMDSDPSDEQGHGTQVSSVLLSVAPELLILPIKVNSGTNISFSTGDAAEAIYYAAARGADIINMSFSTSSFSLAISSAVIYAENVGCLVIAAAGNDGLDVQFPASMDEAVAVGSHDAGGMPSYFSPSGNELDLLGPGENVCATDLDGSAVTASGTSFSAPSVAGAAGVLLSMNKNLTPSSLKSILSKGTSDILDSGWDSTSGYGNLDSASLVAASTPFVDVPVQVTQGEPLTIGLDLPPTDTDTDIYFGLVFNSTTWWMDAAGNWFNAGNTPIEPYDGQFLDAFVSTEIYGPSGSYDSVDTGLHLTGNYLWGTAIFDKNGKLLAPVGWTEMTLN